MFETSRFTEHGLYLPETEIELVSCLVVVICGRYGASQCRQGPLLIQKLSVSFPVQGRSTAADQDLPEQHVDPLRARDAGISGCMRKLRFQRQLQMGLARGGLRICSWMEPLLVPPPALGLQAGLCWGVLIGHRAVFILRT